MTRSFLLLQGPVGPCFRRLAQALTARSHRVTKVNLWGGDVWDFPGGIAYTGTAAAWPAWICHLAATVHTTDLVVFGDQRPAHKDAIAALSDQVITVHVLEEGYLRPNWVTHDFGGANAQSCLATTSVFEAVEAHWPSPTNAHVGPWVSTAARWVILHYIAGALLRPIFRHHRTHRPEHLAREAFQWVRRWLTGPWRRRAATRVLDLALSSKRPLFLLPLQLEHDSQITVYSNFSGTKSVLEHVLNSFAHAAPKGVSIVVKAHPFDIRINKTAATVLSLAEALGIENRVIFLPGGVIAPLTPYLHGVVCVNSTAGLQAAIDGLPVKSLGRAFWDRPGITSRLPLDAFWQKPTPPDSPTVIRFVERIRTLTQINGGFYSDKGLSLLLPTLADRLLTTSAGACTGLWSTRSLVVPHRVVLY